jgi:caa(3)-type oxidase subunit IV
MSYEPHVEEQHGFEPMQYVWIGAALTIITILEVATYWMDLGEALIPLLLFLSAIKFLAVVAFFMHLYFEPQLLIRVFFGSLALAGAVLIALISLFWTDVTDLIKGV